MKIIILAGGGGTRLWPMSRNLQPKQYQYLIGERTMLQQTYDRLIPAFQPDDIYIAVNKNYAHFVKDQLPEIKKSHIFLEPEKRDTAPAMGYAAMRLLKDFPDEPFAFIPSDHLIKEVDVFIQSLQVADQIIRETGKMVDIGVVPTFPNINLGYTKIGKKVREEQGIEFFEFLGHVEKPPLEMARQYVSSGHYLWHANYFMWTPRLFLDAYEQYAPHMYKQLMEIFSSLGSEKELETIERVFPQMEKISVDYAIAEKIDSSQELIIPAKFYWSDVGLWQIIKKEQEESKGSNVSRGEHIALDTKNCLIYGKTKKIIATIGLEDMIVVDTDDALLVCPQSRDKDVKKVVEMLEERGEKKYL